MDRLARWFSREIIVSVAQRVLLESAVAGFVVLAATILTGTTPLISILAAMGSIAGFAVFRIAISCFLNPINSPYLVRWPHPSGEIRPVEQSNVGTETDLALAALEFTARGAIDEWGGAVTNVYTRAANQLIVLTSSDDDLIVLSGLTDNRLVVTTKQLIPPHEQLVVNHCYKPDAQAVLESHDDLLRTLTTAGHEPMAMTLNHIIELLAVEWDAWNQIGPLVGPFVSVGQRRPLGLLQVRVPSQEILERSIAAPPRVTAASRQESGEQQAAADTPSAPHEPPAPAPPAPLAAVPTPATTVAPTQVAVPSPVADAPYPATSFTPAASFVPTAQATPPQMQQPVHHTTTVTPPPVPAPVHQPRTAAPPRLEATDVAPPIPMASLNRRPRRSSMQPSERVAPAMRPVSHSSGTERAA